jgi:apolipoprotein D and lipocalin family protein
MKPKTIHRVLLVTLAAAGVATLAAACSNGPPNPNPRAEVPLQSVPVDLPRYMGRWYVIANIPYFAERDFVGTNVKWTLREDGKIDDEFFGRKNGFDKPVTHHQFLDTVKPGSGGGEWSVQPFWPIHVTQMTLWVDPDYRYTILGYPNKKLGWIFSREATMSEDTYKSMLARLDAMGYDTTRFRRVPQSPEQIGQPGFQSPGQRD